MESRRYTSVAVALHWAIAVLIIGQIAGGLYMHGLANDVSWKFDLYQLHKSFGLSILLLTSVRIGWRAFHPPPALPATMPGWQRTIARATHWLFYGLLIALPLVGWLMVSISPTGIETFWFGQIKVPHLPGAFLFSDAQAGEVFLKSVHKYLAFSMIGLLALHIGAALKHHFVDGDHVLASMATQSRKSLALLGGIFAVLMVGTVFYALNGMPVGKGSSAAPSNVAEPSAGLWVIDQDRSVLRVEGVEKNKPFTATFSRFRVEAAFSPETAERSEIRVIVDTGSFGSGDGLRDSTAPSKAWFDIATFPEAIFETKSVRPTGSGNYLAEGSLSIKDRVMEISIPFTFEETPDGALVRGETTLLRTDFDLGSESTWLDVEQVATEVNVVFELHARLPD